MTEYRPHVSDDRASFLREWHDDVSRELHDRTAADVEYLGLSLHVPAGVFPPTPTSDLLGSQVSATAAPDMRVIDMGCGAGANGLLAAREGAEVVAVDINPASVAAAAANADRNGLVVECLVSDLFDQVAGDFDLVVIDPPFRWFAAADLLERAITDEGYETLSRFLAEVSGRLRPGGAVLLFFGSSGDVAHLDSLIERNRLSSETVAERTIPVRGEDTTYFVRRLSLRGAGSAG